MLLAIFGRFQQYLIFRPRNIYINIQKINFASTNNSRSPFLGFKVKFAFSFFGTSGWNFERSTGISHVRPEFRTSDRNSERLERSAGLPNVRPEFRTSDRNAERSAGISNVRWKFRTLEACFSTLYGNFHFFLESPVTHVLQFSKYLSTLSI